MVTRNRAKPHHLHSEHWHDAQWFAFLSECFEPDFSVGVLRWKKRPVAHFLTFPFWERDVLKRAGRIAGHKHVKGYLSVFIDIYGKKTSLQQHRILWILKHGAWPDDQIDHINCNKSDNRMENMREANNSQNMRNRGPTRKGLKGVTRRTDSNAFQAQISINGRNVYLGSFNTEEEAHAKYMEQAILVAGEFARAA